MTFCPSSTSFHVFPSYLTVYRSLHRPISVNGISACLMEGGATQRGRRIVFLGHSSFLSLRPHLATHDLPHSVNHRSMEPRRTSWKMIQVHLGEGYPSLSVPHWDNHRKWNLGQLRGRSSRSASVRDIRLASGMVSFPVSVRDICTGLVPVSWFNEEIFE